MPLTTTPAAPVAGASVLAQWHYSATSGQYQGDVLYELTAKPAQSTLTLGYITSAPTTESAVDIVRREKFAQLASGSADEDKIQRFAARRLTIDVAGAYSIRAHYFSASHRARVDPNYNDQEARALAAARGDEFPDVWAIRALGYADETLHVGGYTSLPIRTALGVGAILRLLVLDDEIQSAELVDTSDDVARLATLQTAVTAALTALAGSTVAAAGTDIKAAVNDLLAKQNRHVELTGGSVHAAANSANVVPLTDADSTAGAIDTLNRLRAAFMSHVKDSTAAATPWHTEDDLLNLPLAGPARDVASATVLCADLRWRGYERHREQIAAPIAHGASDTSGGLTVAASLLDDLIVALFDALAAQTATPANESEGLEDASTRYGFG